MLMRESFSSRAGNTMLSSVGGARAEGGGGREWVGVDTARIWLVRGSPCEPHPPQLRVPGAHCSPMRKLRDIGAAWCGTSVAQYLRASALCRCRAGTGTVPPRVAAAAGGRAGSSVSSSQQRQPAAAASSSQQALPADANAMKQTTFSLLPLNSRMWSNHPPAQEAVSGPPAHRPP